MVEVTDLFGVTRNYDAADARDKTRQVEREKALLEAAQTGDYSAVTANVDRREHSEVINAANRLKQKYDAITAVSNNDYSQASRQNPTLYGVDGTPQSSYERVFSEGKGYAVYDSYKEADGTQYLAVSGKNSSFIQKINPDGTSERVERTSRDRDDRSQNISKVLGSFSKLKESLGTASDTTDTTDTTVDTSLSDQANKLIASYEHYVETGQDDGGGYLDAETGLPPGASNQQEAFLIRTGNFKPSLAKMKNLIGGMSDGLRQQLVSAFDTGDGADRAIEAAAIDLLYGAVGSRGDSRDFGKLLAMSRISTDAFVQAIGVANTQILKRGIAEVDKDGNPIGYLPEAELQFSIKNGQPIVTGAGGNTGAVYKQRLRSTWYTPEQIQGILSGDVYDNYKEYYDGFRKQFEFMNDIDFLNLKPFDVKKKTTTTPGQTGTGTPSTTGSTGSGAASTGQPTTIQTGTGTTYNTQPINTNTFNTTAPSIGGAGTNTYPQSAVTGTFNTPTQTGNLSAVPTSVTVQDNYTGTNMANLTSASQGGFGGQQTYTNQFGQAVTVTEDASGNPITYVPPGFSKAAAQGGLMTSGYSEGGVAEDKMLEAKYTIAQMRGFKDIPKTHTALNAAANSNEALASAFRAIGASFNQGGVVQGYNTGGLTAEQLKGMQQGLISQTMQPIQAPVAQIQPQEADFIAQGAGQTYAVSPFAESAVIGSTAQAGMPQLSDAGTMTVGDTFTDVQKQTQQLLPAQGVVSQQAQPIAQQQQGTSVSGLTAAQGQAQTVADVAGQTGVPVRALQTGERIDGPTVDQARIGQAFGTGEVQAASVQDELSSLMQQFEGGDTPAWAAGSMRKATAIMAERGLGASSLAGQAIIQAAMEAALPIAQIDAGNKQQMALFKAEQRAKFLGQEFDQAFQAKVQNAARISEIANLNFNAAQQIALENSRAANTMNLNNLSNRQAVVMAEAAALSQLDMANLNNRQQAAVQTAQNFMQMDMANLNNDQQTSMFKAQQNIQSILTDQAAANAASQFNATSENQTNQFFASLTSQVSQFNATQQNGMDQFNVNAVNAMREFNSNLQQQRDLFNAQNGLVVAQANAQWRQNIATINTAAQNESNMDLAQTINALTGKNLDEIWQKERDLMDYTFRSSESAKDRALNILLADKKLEAVKLELQAEEDAAKGSLWTKIFFGDSFTGLFS